MSKALPGLIGWLGLIAAAFAQPGQAATPFPQARALEAVSETWRNYEPKFERRACWFGNIEGAKTADIACGVVSVPEDRTDPQSALIEIAVMTIDADRHRSSTGPLVWIDLGPGDASISKARAQSAVNGRISKLRSATGIVFFDQRGLGHSERNFCRSVPDAFTYGVPVEPDGEAIFSRNMRGCLDQARARGIPVSAYSNWHIALDVRDIRKALKFKKWNVLGFMTSTGIVQAVLQVDPQGVRSAILDSPGPTQPGFSDAASLGMDRTLHRLSDLCSAAPDCKSRNGNLHARVMAILDSYERKPLVITGLNPKAATDGRLIFDDRIAANFLMFMVYYSSVHGDLPAILDVLEDRDRDAIRVYAENWFHPPDGADSQAVRYAIKCRNESGGLGTPPATLAAARSQAPDLERRLGLFRYADDCAALDFGGPDPSAKWTQFDGPVLVTDGFLSPLQRPHVSKMVANQFPAGQYILFAHGGVIPLLAELDGCGGEILAEFLAEPGRPVASKCAVNDPAPDFLTDYRRTGKPGLLLMNFQSGKYPILPVALLLGVAVAFIAMPSRWVIKRFRRRSQASIAVVPRAELVGWIAILLSVVALAIFAFTVMGWVEEHPAAVPAGLPSSILGSLAVAVLAGLVALLSLLFTWRARKHITTASFILIIGCAFGTFATLLWIWLMV